MRNNALLTSILLLAFTNLAMVIYSFTGWGYDLFDYLFGPSQRFDDFYNCFTLGKDLFKPNNVFVLAPLLALVVQWVAWMNHDFLFILSNLFYFVGGAYFLSKYLPKSQVILTLPLLYPIYFLFSRANNDQYTFVFFVMFLYLLKEDRQIAAAIVLGLLAAFKPPLLSLVIVFARRIQIKETLLTGFVFIVIFLGPLFFLKGGFEIQFQYFRETVQNYYKIYVVNDAGYLHGSSIFGLVKTVIYSWREAHFVQNPAFLEYAREYIAALYGKISLLAMGVTFLYSVFGVMQERTRLLLIVSITIVFPHVSADYRLVFLVPSFLWALYEALEQKKYSFELIVLGLTMIPKGYYVFIFKHTDQVQTLNSVINPLLLLSLVGYIVVKSWKSSISTWKNFVKLNL